MGFLVVLVCGYIRFVVNYLLLLCFIPIFLVCCVCWVVGAISMFWEIPVSIIMLLTGHASGWTGLLVGAESLFICFAASAVCLYAWELRKKVGKKQP
jgi:hypothetical protein